MESIKFNIESIKQEKGDTILTAIASNADFLPFRWLKYAAKDSINQRLIWRHSDPENRREEMTDEVFGRIITCKVKSVEENPSLYTEYKLFDFTEDQRSLIELIKKRNEVEDPLGISMGYLKYTDKETDEIKHITVLEHSITPIPKCKVCKTIDIKESVVKMEEKELKKLKDKIAELEDELNGKSTKIEELESKVVVFEEEIKGKDGEIKVSKSNFEESKTMILSLKDEITELKKDLILKEKKPIIVKIYEWEQDDDLLKFYETMEIKELEARLVKVKKAREGKPIVKSLSKSRDEIIEDEELEKKEKETREESIKSLAKTNPEIAKILKEMEEKGDL